MILINKEHIDKYTRSIVHFPKGITCEKNKTIQLVSIWLILADKVMSLCN